MRDITDRGLLPEAGEFNRKLTEKELAFGPQATDENMFTDY